MINAPNATFNKRPKTLNAIGMNTTTSIFFVMVVNSEMFEAISCQMVIAGKLISKKGGISINRFDCKRDI